MPTSDIQAPRSARGRGPNRSAARIRIDPAWSQRYGPYFRRGRCGSPSQSAGPGSAPPAVAPTAEQVQMQAGQLAMQLRWQRGARPARVATQRGACAVGPGHPGGPALAGRARGGAGAAAAGVGAAERRNAGAIGPAGGGRGGAEEERPREHQRATRARGCPAAAGDARVGAQAGRRPAAARKWIGRGPRWANSARSWPSRTAKRSRCGWPPKSFGCGFRPTSRRTRSPKRPASSAPGSRRTIPRGGTIGATHRRTRSSSRRIMRRPREAPGEKAAVRRLGATAARGPGRERAQLDARQRELDRREVQMALLVHEWEIERVRCQRRSGG